MELEFFGAADEQGPRIEAHVKGASGEDRIGVGGEMADDVLNEEPARRIEGSAAEGGAHARGGEARLDGAQQRPRELKFAAGEDVDLKAEGDEEQ